MSEFFFHSIESIVAGLKTFTLEELLVVVGCKIILDVVHHHKKEKHDDTMHKPEL